MFMTFKFPDKLAIRQKGWFWFCNGLYHLIKTLSPFSMHDLSPNVETFPDFQIESEIRLSDDIAQKG